uniref:Uncharacterized protein n=1 Tax=Rhizophora mucronata TaxID=61149 RepID=A0A2P2P5X2_RHIMU
MSRVKKLTFYFSFFGFISL